MRSGELAKDQMEAEEQLELHHERKAEIDGRYNHYLKLRVSKLIFFRAGVHDISKSIIYFSCDVLNLMKISMCY